MFAPSPSDRHAHALDATGLDAEFAELAASIEPPNLGRMVVLRGAPGLGKSTLASRLVERAADSGMRVLDSAGIPHESTLPFWTLHQLVSPLLSGPADDGFGRSLVAAMGRPAPSVGERLDLSRQALAWVEGVASSHGLLLVVDDAEWMDEPTRDLLCFVQARSRGNDLALVLVYNRPVPAELRNSRLVEFELLPLAPDDASEVLRARHPHMPLHVQDRIIEEADGNRLALRDIPSALSRAQLEGLDPLPPVLPVPRPLLDFYRETLATLPPSARRELALGAVDAATTGAADPSFGPPSWDAEALAALEEHDLVVRRSDGGVHFASRVVRSAVAALTSPTAAREMHRELAARHAGDPRRSAAHRAALAEAPDETIAADLSAHARDIACHGRSDAAIRMLLDASALSPSPARGAERALHAAAVAASSGQGPLARRLLDRAARTNPEAPRSVHDALLRSRIGMQYDGDYTGASRLVNQAVWRWRADATGTTATNVGVQTAVQLSVLIDDPGVRGDVARLVRSAEPALSRTTRLVALTSLPPSGAPLTRPLTEALRDAHREESSVWSPEDALQFGLAAARSDSLGDYRSTLIEAHQGATRSGSLAAGLEMKALLATEAFQSGRWDESQALAARGRADAENSELHTVATEFRHVLALIAAARGDVRACAELCAAIDTWAIPRQAAHHRARALEARLLSALSQGDGEAAWSGALRALARGQLPEWPLYGSRLILDVVEALLRTGHTTEAGAIARHAEAATTRHHPVRLRFVVTAACALTGPESEAAHRFDDALGIDGIDRWPFEHARVQYLYGQWLRRHFANGDARSRLTSARALFDLLGAGPWSRRAGNELRAAGVRVNAAPSPDAAVAELTPQETEVAALAAAGLSNKAIATRLFISPRTVSGHLYRIFPKLNVVSRAGLRDALATRTGPGERAV